MPNTQPKSTLQDERWKEVSPLIEEVWIEVFKTVNKILQTHVKFGFGDFAKQINPSIDDILNSLKIAALILDTIDASTNLEYAETRLISNSKQQIWLIRRVAEALKNDQENDYVDAIEFLRKQSQH